MGESDSSRDWATFRRSQRPQYPRKAVGLPLSGGDSPSDAVSRQGHASSLRPPWAGLCLLIRLKLRATQESSTLTRVGPPSPWAPQDEPAPHPAQTGPLPHTPSCVGCQPGPGHPPAALLRPHPPSQGGCPAGHHPAGPEPHPRAGGRLPGLLRHPGQVPGPPSLTTPRPTLRPPPLTCSRIARLLGRALPRPCLPCILSVPHLTHPARPRPRHREGQWPH